MPSTSEPIRPLKRSTMPLVCGDRGRVWRYSAPSAAPTLAKRGVKQLPLSVSTWVRRKGKAAAASRKGDGAPLCLVVLDGKVDGARVAVDGDIEIALAALAVGGLQLRQVLDVDVDEAEVVFLEPALAPLGAVRGGGWPAVQPLSPEDAPDAVAIEMRQEVGGHKGEVVEGEVRRPSQGADDGPLFLARLPGQPMWPGRVVLAVRRATLPPFANGLGADAEALGQHPGRLPRAGDLGPDRRRGAGIGVDLQHGSPRSRISSAQGREAICVFYDREPNRIPTMFRDLTPNLTVSIPLRPSIYGG